MNRENQISKVIVESALQIHTNLGPGLYESVYEVVLADELQYKGLKQFGRCLFLFNTMEENSKKDLRRTFLSKIAS